MDLKIFLLHKDSSILEGLEVFFNMIDTDFGVTVEISTFDLDDTYNLYMMATDDNLFEGYGIIIFNTFHLDYIDTIQALDTKAPDSVIFHEQGLQVKSVTEERFHPISKDFCSDLQLIFDEDYITQITKAIQNSHTIIDDSRFEKSMQVLQLKGNSSQDNNDELPIEVNTTGSVSTNVDLSIKDMLAAQVAGFHLQNNDLQDVVEGVDGTTEVANELDIEEQTTDNVQKVIINDITESDEAKKQGSEYNQGDGNESASDKDELDKIIENDEKTEILNEYPRDSHIIGGASTEQLCKTKENEEFDTQDEKFEDLPFERTRLIQKQLFAKQHWEGHKSIGIWSPLPKMGVTTFAINFAMFLAENRIYAGVLEGLKNEPMLKHWIKRYTPIPKDWTSYAKAVHSTAADSYNADWTYRNVLYLPLDDDDSALQWSADKLAMYLNTPALMDVTLIDLPSGIMHEYTYHSLYYLTELWVLVDDTYQELVAWKQYIHAIQKKYDVKIKLIFNKQYEFSQVKRLAESLDFDVICTLPALHEEVMRNYYETQPLLYSEGVREKLYEPFVELTKYLMGKDFKIQTTLDNQILIPTKDEDKYWTAFLDKFKRWLKDLS